MDVPIDETEVRRIAALARLAIREEEIPPLTDHFRKILAHFGRLSNLDMKGIDPFDAQDVEAMPLREDKVIPWEGRETALQAAPRRSGDFFRVPRIVEEG
jgi:aspartyl-tRNA(Asn)/glutamyl-tRNA(Gln) amidotransferase subunit C